MQWQLQAKGCLLGLEVSEKAFWVREGKGMRENGRLPETSRWRDRDNRIEGPEMR